jgi:1,4-alpha-glucan branching enzyme
MGAQYLTNVRQYLHSAICTTGLSSQKKTAMKTHTANRRAPARIRRRNSRTQLVHFELVDPAARSVCIAGTFNDWHPSVTEMIALGEGRWAKELTLVPGAYEYLFVVDGQWTTDPAANESVANPFGGRNSVLRVGRTPGS